MFNKVTDLLEPIGLEPPLPLLKIRIWYCPAFTTEHTRIIIKNQITKEIS